jgi:uncharacterized protein YbjT (DUF2867 family)
MIVISGATGNVGRSLVEQLVRDGREVTAVSRGAGPAGVRHVRADLAEPGSLRSALAGAEAFFLLVPGAGAHLDPVALIGAVRAAGVRRIVLLSSQAAATRPDAESHAPLRALERVVEDSGAEWTHLRPGGFASNAFAWAPSVRAERLVAAPFGDVALPVVDPADIAEVAATVLTSDGHGRRAYEITGPEATTPRQRARALGDALGEPVRFAEQTPDQARAQMLGFMPAPVVEGTLAIRGEPTAAEQRVSPDVQGLLGRRPGTFAAWAQRNVTAFR